MKIKTNDAIDDKTIGVRKCDHMVCVMEQSWDYIGFVIELLNANDSLVKLLGFSKATPATSLIFPCIYLYFPGELTCQNC